MKLNDWIEEFKRQVGDELHMEVKQASIGLNLQHEGLIFLHEVKYNAKKEPERVGAIL